MPSHPHKNPKLTSLAEHLPAIQSNPSFSLKAIYSRSQTSASALASAATGGSPDVYYDTPTTQGKDLASLLARPDIHAVFIALPILAQPAVIRQALEAGKHVLSEKPVAADVEGARGLVRWYESLGGAGGKRPIWAVAENYRFIASLEYAAKEVERVGGGLATFSMRRNGIVRRGGKYFETECEFFFVLLVWDGVVLTVENREKGARVPRRVPARRRRALCRGAADAAGRRGPGDPQGRGV